MRIFVNNLAILERARLGLVRIANQVNGLAAAAIDQRPLEAARKTRAAPPAQPRSLDLLAQLLLRRHFFAVRQVLGRERKRLLERVVAAVAQIAVQVGCVTRLVDVPKNQSEFLRHRALTLSSKTIISPRSGLPDGVTVAQQILNLLVMVQIHVGQPIGQFFIGQSQLPQARQGRVVEASAELVKPVPIPPAKTPRQSHAVIVHLHPLFGRGRMSAGKQNALIVICEAHSRSFEPPINFGPVFQHGVGFPIIGHEARV